MKGFIFLVLMLGAGGAGAQCNPYSENYYDCEMWSGPTAFERTEMEKERKAREEDRKLLREIAERERLEEFERFRNQDWKK